jgi:hypothetical protein
MSAQFSPAKSLALWTKRLAEATRMVALRRKQVAAQKASAKRQAWHPKAKRVPYKSSGAFVPSGPKLVWHITIGSGLPTYSGSAPHFTINPKTGELWQHIPITEASSSLLHPQGTVETNHAHAVQVEVIAFASIKDPGAANHPELIVSNWSDADYARLAKLARWIEHNAGVPRTCGVKFIPGAVRLQGQRWLDYAGHCGHMHVPNNDHYDPTGDFKIAKVLK